MDAGSKRYPLEQLLQPVRRFARKLGTFALGPMRRVGCSRPSVLIGEICVCSAGDSVLQPGVLLAPMQRKSGRENGPLISFHVILTLHLAQAWGREGAATLARGTPCWKQPHPRSISNCSDRHRYRQSLREAKVADTVAVQPPFSL